MIEDSSILTFPNKGGTGKNVVINEDIVFRSGRWTNLTMKGIGGGAVPDFTEALAAARALLGNPVEMLSEEHFAVVFMNINDYSDNMKFIGDQHDVQTKFLNDVNGMIDELKCYRNCLVVCGPNASYWGCTCQQAPFLDDAIDVVHTRCRANRIPCIRGASFWRELEPSRRTSAAGNRDRWHHADMTSGRMSFIIDRFFSQLYFLFSDCSFAC